MDISFFSHRKKTPVVLQNEMSECGLASLTMCFQHHGLDVSLHQLRSKYRFGKEGMSIADLSSICENEGLIGDVYELGMEHMPELTLPAVLHWDLSHFVVLSKINGKKYTIHDPAVGKILMTEEEVAKHFTGYAMMIEIAQAEAFNAAKTTWELANEKARSLLTFRELFFRSKGLAKGLLNLIVLTFVAQLMVMTIPLVSQVVIDDFVGVSENQYLLPVIFGGIGLTLFIFVVRMFRGWASIVIGYHWHASFSSYFFQRLVRLPISYFESRNIADINTKFRVLDQLKESFTEQLVDGFIDGLMSIVTIIVMFIYMPVLALISGGFFLFYWGLRTYLVRQEVLFAGTFFTESVKESHTFFETISNMLAVKLYGREGARYQQWKAFYVKKMNASVVQMKLKLWYTASNELLGQVERLIILYIGALAVIQQEITLGMLFAFIAYREIFSTQSKSLVDNILSFKILKVDLDRLSDIEVEDVEANMLGDGAIKQKINGRVSTRQLTYVHDGARSPLFENLNIDIEDGEHVVITGPSGVGKTTLIKLLAGVIEPTQGDILIDNVPLHSIGKQHYRKHVAIISQQEGLISGTLFMNIAFADTVIDEERVYEAAKKAHVYDEIMHFPMQFHTVVAGSHSTSLSGGQVQRILIARALYANPSILFMDEATSALDHAMEKKVVATLNEMNITRISVAHRKETIATADREIALA
ncbi:peptidase domain-containing ABC transporter [Agaribacter flavus]|uniref:Peptidase domain-containing ABC transporter n=1 Tax=Agaribacter flavus TaxID=1902781 RepID=A0ABV7FME0_9ALTE